MLSNETISKHYIIISAILFLLAGFLLFFNTFGNTWTLDDFPVIVNNPDIRSLELFWKDAYPGRPLRELTFLIDYSIFGLQPAGYHLQQIFWHSLNAWLIFVLVVQLAGKEKIWTATIASILFLAHPLHVEVVANISHRKDSLALAFSLLSFLSYMIALKDDKRRLGPLIGAGFLFLAAAYAKQTVIVLPLIYVAYEFAYLPREKRFLLKYPKVMAIAIILGAVAVVDVAGFWSKDALLSAMSSVMAKMNLSFSPDSPERYFLVYFKSLAFMFSKWIWPVDLAPEYAYSAPKSWSDLWVVSAVIGLLLYFAALYMTSRRSPLAFMALVWMGLFWLPVSNLLPVSYFAADRYLYAPSAGFLIFVTVCTGFEKERFRSVKISFLVLIFGAFVFLTWTQNKVWASRLTLWTQAVKVSPESTTALNNLGSVYMLTGELDKALVYYKRAAKNFSDPMPYYNIGWIYEQKGDVEKAAKNYRYFLAFHDSKYQGIAGAMRQRFYKKFGIILR